jgi:hypothetical protein
MNKRIIHISVLIFACCCLFGCDSKQSSSVGVAKQSWKLANGTEFSCWVSSDKNGSRIASDLQKGPISYRIIGGGESADWKPMTPDPNGKFGAAEVLHRGRYMIQFKVGAEEFSALTLDVD